MCIVGIDTLDSHNLGFQTNIFLNNSMIAMIINPYIQNLKLKSFYWRVKPSLHISFRRNMSV